MAEPLENDQKDHPSSPSKGRSVRDGNPLATEKTKNLLAQLRRGLQTTDNVVVWTREEQRIIEEGIIKFASLPSVVKYAKIAVQLSNKTMYDVAFRSRWMAQKKRSKRRREEEDRLTKNLEDKKKGVSHSSPLNPVADVEGCAGIFHEAIDGEEGELLLSTSLALRQISENIASFKIHENLELLVKARDNILKMTNNCNFFENDGLMKDAPPLGVEIDEEKVNVVLSFPLPKDLPLAIMDKAAEILRRKKLALHQISENLEDSQLDENIEMFANAGDNILKMTNNLADEDRLVKEALPINVETTEEVLNSILPRPPPKEPSFRAFF